MKLGVVKRILKEDLARSGDLPAWIDQLLVPLNDFIEKAGLALTSRLTFTDNFLCKRVTQTFNSGQTYEISPNVDSTKKLKAVDVFFGNMGGATVTKTQWFTKTNGNIGVTIFFDTALSAVCTITIFLG